MDRQPFFTGSPWEPAIGFARAVRKGQVVYFSGTLDTGPDGKPIGKDAYEQARNIFLKFETILKQIGFSLESVVRTRMFLVDPADADAVGRAHKELLGETFPAATMLIVAGFLGEGFRVEIEAEAVLE